MGYTRGRTITHCPYCGSAYPVGAKWPRDCPGCGETNWANPLPVAVALQPVITRTGTSGLVVVRRDVEPCRGQLAFPGGYIEVGETWQEAAARELKEETGLDATANGIQLFDAWSAVNTLDIFALLPARDAEALPMPAPTAETSEWFVLHEATALAFPAHSAAMRAYFSLDRVLR
ncbi:NUDIX domain-containing protein [Streptomyces caatingaensis]|uniref:NUDIX domain-containing protein n=1 Tax=Streptomyces caatingaensis TaxID=1678637 RepID=UPI00099CA1FC|nr:NUDIX domain-containing protein [Streptomyces caatingaensis]